MIRHRTLGFAEQGNATARSAAISSWDAMVERFKELGASEPEQPGPAKGKYQGTWDEIQAWLEKNKTVVYVSAIGLIGLAVLRRR